MPGCFQISPQILKDHRGDFIKTLHQEIFENHGLQTHFAEEYYSISRKGVLRGLHFQTPPHEHTKLVYCVAGAVLDAIVDLRLGSPAFGQFAIFELNAEKANMLYIPPGLAHGFYARTENVTMMYKVSTVYSPRHDGGIRWNSANIPWPDDQPILSGRDATFPGLSEFKSPFQFNQRS